MEIIYTLLEQLGGKKFIAIAKKVSQCRFTPDVLDYLTHQCYGIRAEFEGGKVILIIYDDYADLYILHARIGCKNPEKIYSDLYYDQLLDIIENETGIKMP